MISYFKINLNWAKISWKTLSVNNLGWHTYFINSKRQMVQRFHERDCELIFMNSKLFFLCIIGLWIVFYVSLDCELFFLMYHWIVNCFFYVSMDCELFFYVSMNSEFFLCIIELWIIFLCIIELWIIFLCIIISLDTMDCELIVYLTGILTSFHCLSSFFSLSILCIKGFLKLTSSWSKLIFNSF